MSSNDPAILVVDDETLVREVLGAMLSRLGYRPLLAGSGAAGVELLRAREDDVAAAVLDVRMPDMDGPATMDALRELVPGLPCVFVSGDTGPYTVGDLLARGASGVLDKPVAMDYLGRAIAAAAGTHLI
jgi:CheY-like chemotaxis protein